ncbi:MAG: lipid-A-disaccharide synthase [Alphaproteobacteria bacterium]|nr:lipid-A-disaccharide synthase [Alphaproteobacteria bacterium]
MTVSASDATAEGARPLVYLIAGEVSGDQLGGGLMAALRRSGQPMRFAGVGGARMSEQGLASLFPMRELSVMGLLETLPRLPRLLRRIRETADDIVRRDPDVIVTIDAPSFAMRVMSRVASRRAPRLHYVAPQLWAWRPGRIHTYRKTFDRLLALLPFEPKYFEPKDMRCTFVGHPAAMPGKGDAEGFRARHGVANGGRVLLLLPGSRSGEIARMLPVLAEAARKLQAAYPALKTALLAAPGHETELRAATAFWEDVPLVIETQERADLFAASSLALATSGTVSVELAAAGVPHVIAYRVNPLTAWIARRLVHVKYADLVNIILDRPVVPELIQQDCTPERLAEEGARLLTNSAATAQRDGFAEATRRMLPDGKPPFERAAEAVLAALSGRR